MLEAVALLLKTGLRKGLFFERFQKKSCNNGHQSRFLSFLIGNSVNANHMDIGKILRSEDYWKSILSPQQFRVMRKGKMEKPFSGNYVRSKAQGIYHCAGCGNPLFSSDAKYKAKTGWASFYFPLHENSVGIRIAFRSKVEVFCPVCGCFLGQLLRDKKSLTGRGYNINSLSLDFYESPDRVSL